jgi:hypothetical protein
MVDQKEATVWKDVQQTVLKIRVSFSREVHGQC